MENIIFDGNNSTTKGLKFINCNYLIFKNVEFKNFKQKNSNEGFIYAIDLLGCKNVFFEECRFNGINATGSANGVARAIQAENNGDIISYNINIEKCVFDTILPNTDGDAIHFNQPNNNIKATVEGCIFKDIAKRGVKAQAEGVIVKDCVFEDDVYKNRLIIPYTIFSKVLSLILFPLVSVTLLSTDIPLFQKHTL